MKKSVTTRQSCLILILTAITTKLLFLPSLLCQEVGRDAYLYVLVYMLLEVGILAIFLYLSYKFPEHNFKEIVEVLFGKVFSKVILSLYFIFFLFQTSIIFQSTYVYIYENLYSELQWYVYAFPLIITISYVCFKGLNGISRLIEMFFPILFIGVVVAFFLGSINADYSNILPFMDKNFFLNVGDISKYALWFSDYLVYIVLFGEVKMDKGHFKKLIIAAICTAVFVSLFVMVFYCLYDYSAIFHKNAITEVMQVIPRSSDIGSLDWVITLIWDASMIIYMCLKFFASTRVFKFTFCIKKDWINILLVLIFMAVLVYLTKFNMSIIIEYSTKYIKYFYYVVSFLLPIIMFIIAIFKKPLQKVKKQIKERENA